MAPADTARMKQNLGQFIRTPFGSAVLGGAVVGVLGWIAIAAGWVDGSTTHNRTVISQPPLTRTASQDSGGLSVDDIYKKDGPGVVFVQSQITQNVPSVFGFAQKEQSTATGSGFVIDTKGDILTNNHVVAGAHNITVKIGKGSPVKATVVGRDPSSDIALLHVDVNSSELHPLTLGNSSDAQVGDPVVAIGNPFGLDRTVTRASSRRSSARSAPPTASRSIT